MSVRSEIVVDDWEGIDDTELNTKLDQLKKNATNSQVTTGNDSGQPFNVMLMNDDDCIRTQYVPPEPVVKILKRPTNDKNNQQSAEARPKAPIKTLQQREQEYAEARLRILGSAKSAEDEEEESAIIVDRNGFITTNNDKNGVADSNTNRPLIRNNSSPLMNATTASARNYSPLQSAQQSSQLQLEMRRIDDNVIRLPRGPDGTAGFILKR